MRKLQQISCANPKFEPEHAKITKAKTKSSFFTHQLLASPLLVPRPSPSIPVSPLKLPSPVMRQASHGNSTPYLTAYLSILERQKLASKTSRKSEKKQSSSSSASVLQTSAFSSSSASSSSHVNRKGGKRADKKEAFNEKKDNYASPSSRNSWRSMPPTSRSPHISPSRVTVEKKVKSPREYTHYSNGRKNNNDTNININSDGARNFRSSSSSSVDSFVVTTTTTSTFSVAVPAMSTSSSSSSSSVTRKLNKVEKENGSVYDHKKCSSSRISHKHGSNKENIVPDNNNNSDKNDNNINRCSNDADNSNNSHFHNRSNDERKDNVHASRSGIDKSKTPFANRGKREILGTLSDRKSIPTSARKKNNIQVCEIRQKEFLLQISEKSQYNGEKEQDGDENKKQLNTSPVVASQFSPQSLQQSLGSDCQGFAYVTTLVKESPAEVAGLQCGDVIVQFGNLTKSNFVSLFQFTSIVKAKAGRNIKIYVIRRTLNTNQIGVPIAEAFERLELEASIAKWTKGGVLGCVVNCWPPEPRQ